MNPVFLTGSLLLLLAAIPANLIVLLYFKIPWRASRLGRIMASKAAAIALVLDFSVISSIMIALGYERPLWSSILRLVVFSLVVIALWFQWHEYRAILREGRADDVSAHNLANPDPDPSVN